jgi:hypothetical protein
MAMFTVKGNLKIHLDRIGLSIIARDSDGGGSAAGVQLLITLFY